MCDSVGEKIVMTVGAFGLGCLFAVPLCWAEFGWWSLAFGFMAEIIPVAVIWGEG